MSVINTNISSMQAQSSVRTSGLNLSTAMERLSSGVRINSAKDDAAGLAISTRMTASIRGISAAVRNANDGISLTQTAEGSLAQISDNLQRIRELAVQSANTGNNASDRAAMNNEAKQLVAEIDRVANNTTYNGIKLLDGSFQAQNLQVGAGNGSNDRIAISIGSAKSSALGVGSNSSYAASTVGVAVGSTALAASALNINGYSTGAAADDGVSNTDPATSGIAVAAAINAISASTKVTATVGQTTVNGAEATEFDTAIAAGDVKINGVSIGPIAASSSAGGRGNQVAAAVNAISSQTGVTATFDSSTGAVALNAVDGRNITVEAVNAGGATAVTGLGMGSATSMAAASSAASLTSAIADFTINGVAIDDVAATPSSDVTHGAAAPAVAYTSGGNADTAQVTTLAFDASSASGHTYIQNGITFTTHASTGILTKEELADAFATLGTLAANDDSATISGTGTLGTLASGVYTATTGGASGTFSGTATAAATYALPSGTNSGSVTITPEYSTSPVSFTESGTHSGVTVTVTDDPSIAGTQVSTVTFVDIDAGASVTVNGLTFTAGDNGADAAELELAFASVVTTAASVAFDTDTSGAQAKWEASASYDEDIGSFTAGSTAVAGTFAAVTTGTTTAVTFTTTDTGLGTSTSAILSTTSGSEEIAEVTFNAIKEGESVTLNGLTFTALQDLTDEEVAEAFELITYDSTSGATNRPRDTNYGAYTGAWLNGYDTGAASGATVTATAAAVGTTDLAVSSNKFEAFVDFINDKTSETGVTATLVSAGKVSLASTAGIVLDEDGPAATVTGISGTLVADTASNTATARSKVTLSTTDSGGINVSGSTAAALTAAGLSEGSATVTATAGAGVSSIDLTTATGSQAALTTLDSAINTITDSRAAMGAYQNRLTASISNLETTSMNLSASRSRILDTDYAKETTNLAKSQIIQQAATAMLAQANQSGQSVLALLK